MPCRYEETPEEIAAAKTAREKQIVEPYKAKLDKLTRLLCWVMTQVYTEHREIPPADWLEDVLKNNTELGQWWKAHQEEDARRTAQEKTLARNKALAKLTTADKKALGLE